MFIYLFINLDILCYMDLWFNKNVLIKNGGNQIKA